MGKDILDAVFEGQVQGVFFRANTRDKALQLGLTGWVRNLPDGRVQLHAEGSRKELETLLEYLKAAPQASKVEDVDKKWGRGEGEYDSFKIIY
ncbi:MAG: acylphosphatase [Candidatus Altiarchaeales archaeon]|nr:acylphosphatase [Candidatus Altiarchaeales archaeon]